MGGSGGNEPKGMQPLGERGRHGGEDSTNGGVGLDRKGSPFKEIGRSERSRPRRLRPEEAGRAIRAIDRAKITANTTPEGRG
jgi:hypothetical protein